MRRAAALVRRARAASSGERGSAPVEFALVAPLVLLLALAVVQLALAMHVRTTLTSAAAEGARTAAAAGRTGADGAARVRALVKGAGMDGVVSSITVSRTTRRGLPVVVVVLQARLPLLGLLGPTSMTVHGTSFREL